MKSQFKWSRIATIMASACLYFGVHAQSFDQQFVPPPPSVAELGKYGNLPVSFYTGTPQISVPLGAIGDAQLQHTLSLSHHASGVRISEVSPWTGMNWSLIAGGSISRQLRGAEDFGTNGYSNMTAQMPTPGALVSFDCSYEHGDATNMVESILSNQIDAQADLFNFNIGGMSGQFVLDTLGGVHQIPKQNVFINPPLSQNGSWIIKDPNGWTYEFGGNAGNGQLAQDVTHLDYPLGDVVMTWHLTSITTPTGQTMSFEYDFHEVEYTPFSAESVIITHPNSNPAASGNCGNTFQFNTSSAPPREFDAWFLKRVHYGSQEVELVASTNRCDIEKGVRLESVVFKRYGLIEKQFDLAYDCENNKKRMWLLSVTEHGQGAAQAKPAWEFTYLNRSLLPQRNAYQQDHWGYHNSNPANSVMLPEPPWTWQNGMTINWPSVDRSTDPAKVTNGSIYRITYPTGGHTEFEFQAAEYYDIAAAQNEYGGGIRIKTIRDHDGLSTANDMVRRFTYELQPGQSSGLLMREPSYYFESMTESSNGTCYFVNGIATGAASMSMAASGNPVGYSKVAVFTENSTVSQFGKTEYEFNNQPDLTATNYLWTNMNAGNSGSTVTPLSGINFLPGVPSGKQYSHLNGLQTAKTEYRFYNGSYYPQHKTATSYAELDLELMPNWVFNGRVNLATPFHCIELSGGAYFEQSSWVKPVSITETLWDGEQTNLGTAMVIQKQLGYTPVQHMLATESWVNSKGKTVETTFVYPENANGNLFGTPCSTLLSKHILSPVLKKEVKVSDANGSSTSGEGFAYNTDGLPTGHLMRNTETGVYTSEETFAYDANGRLTTANKTNGLTKSILWADGENLPVAEALNAALGEVHYTSFESITASGFTYNSGGITTADARTGAKCYDLLNQTISNNNLAAGDFVVCFWAKGSGDAITLSSGQSVTPASSWTYFELPIAGGSFSMQAAGGAPVLVDEVRIMPVDCQMQTVAYDEFSRVKTLCDENNFSSGFEYDAHGRLTLVRDDDGNILQRNQYNFGN